MSNLFRQNALDTMATPEQLDKQVKIINPAVWLICVILITGLVTFFLWAFTYKCVSTINIKGIVFTNNDIVQKKVQRKCIVNDVLVKEGDYVNIGDIIAVISYDEMLERINTKKTELKNFQENSDQYKNIESEIQELIDNYIASTVIKSSNSGYIQNVVSNGTALDIGDNIFSLMQDSGYNEVVAYVSMQTAKNINTGMTTQISPIYAPREEYGYMTGTIISIGDMPISEERIIAKMGTLSYVKNILPETSFVEVRIRLDINDTDSLNSKYTNNYHWSNKKGEQLAVEFGSQCSIAVVTDEYLPIKLLLN